MVYSSPLVHASLFTISGRKKYKINEHMLDRLRVLDCLCILDRLIMTSHLCMVISSLPPLLVVSRLLQL